jgi:hypothetical protein
MTHAHEEAEHAQHHSHSPFDKRVAMTMVIIASLLAAVKVLAHRSHNQAILAQQKASNQWAYYQAKKNRQYNLEMAVKLPLLLNDSGRARAALDALRALNPDLAFVAAKAPEGEKKPRKKKPEAKTAAELSAQWKADIKRWKADTEKIEKDARSYEAEVEHAHHQSDRFDLGELFLELGLVLCAAAILTKRTGFWYAGMLVSLVGVASAATGFFVH